MPIEAKQRFLDLDVNEISVVDTPANEVEFLVMKRHQENKMDEQTTVETEKAETAEVVAVESESNSDNADVTKALEQVAQIVDTVAKAAGVAAPSVADDEETQKADSDEEATEKGAHDKGGKGGMGGKGGKFDPRAMFGKQLKKAGIEGEAFEKAMADFDKSYTPFKPGASAQPPLKKGETATTKAADGVEETATADDIEDTSKALDALEQAIQKAKRFTPKREAQLKSAVEALQKLLGEMTQVAPGASPKSMAQENSFGASGVQSLTKAVAELTAAVSKSLEGQEALNGRIEAIEKARTPSNSLPEDTTETTETKKNKSIWAGVL